MKGFIIAGTNSGCGKTTATIGLMALLKSLNYNITPFKTGPDYIDPLFHSKVLGVPSYNLDSFMLSESAIKHLYRKHAAKADLSIIEGVMGMYDGMGQESRGSTYELSRILDIPVILVVNCKGLYQSIAAIIKGFANYKEDTKVRGVILNHVSSKDHFKFLQSIIEKECGIKCIGYIPTNKDFALESRHLGLIQAEEVDELDHKIELIKETFNQTIDFRRLMSIADNKEISEDSFELPKLDLSALHIGVAYDKAFRFYYKDNLELLNELGSNLHYFSPIEDNQLPEECNCLYLGGGYPEVFANELSQNKSLLKEIKDKIDNGMPAYAECGGLMYLTEKIITQDQDEYEMTGVFEASVQMTKRLQRFGYAIAQYEGESTPCHEFHRSQIIPNQTDVNYELKYQLKKPEKELEWQCGLQYKNCLGAYAHVHFYADLKFFEKITELWKRAII